jgi:hypothetical protein
MKGYGNDGSFVVVDRAVLPRCGVRAHSRWLVVRDGSLSGTITSMGNLRRALNDLPVPTRYAVIGAVVLGILGAIAGLVIGLFAYPPTAWFAIFELGLPAALLGGLLGLGVGSVVYALRRTRDNSRT